MASALTLVAVVALVVAVGMHLLGGDDDRRRGQDTVRLASLTHSTTDARLGRVPVDPEPFATTEGEVVRPTRMLPVFATPGRDAFAKVGPRQLGELWLPVIDTRGGWSRVLLPSRPNRAAGWVRTDQVERRSTAYLVRVHLDARRLDLFYDGRRVGSWSVAVGAPETPTPTGRTFLLGSITDERQDYSPVILPLGTHSDTLDTYGGGPGTVAIHSWPDASVFGTAASHGCVRIPPDALERLSQVPLGTLVIVTQK